MVNRARPNRSSMTLEQHTGLNRLFEAHHKKTGTIYCLNQAKACVYTANAANPNSVKNQTLGAWPGVWLTASV